MPAYPFKTNWPTLSQLVELFTAMGCVLSEPDAHVEGPDGKHPVRFLYNPETEGFASLNSYDDDERIPPSEVENWERRLGVDIPKKWDGPLDG